MNVPFLDLKAEFKLFKKEIKASFETLFKSQQWILSEQVAECEQAVCRYLSIQHAIGVSSGTEALLLSLRSVAINRFKKEFFSSEDEILVPSFTFVASAETIIRAGGKPVFVDVDPNTFNVTAESLERAITPRTKGIIVVHLFGVSAPMEEISALAQKHNLFIIEDCAQSFGARANAKAFSGTLGACGCFSFFPTKNLGAFGDAGMIVTQDKTLNKIIRALRNHGGEDKYNIDYIGYNARLDAIQAQVLLVKLKYLGRFLKTRKEIAAVYTKELAKIASHIVVPKASAYHTYNQYTIRVLNGQRDRLKEYLHKKGIATQVYYPVALHTMKVFEPYCSSVSLPNTEQLMTEVLSLPVSPTLTKPAVSYVISSINTFFQNSTGYARG